jgi:amidase
LRRLDSIKVIYEFSSKNKPAYNVSQGEAVIVATQDCFSGMVNSPKKLFEEVAMDDVNPATGPIIIDGLVAGDTLCVSINKIKCGPLGIMMCSPNVGFLSDDVRRSRTKILKIHGGKATFSPGLEIDLKPHIGVLGVSPAKGRHPTFYPGDHGGNMDTVEVAAGSKVYLPTFVDGAMVAMGDLHAAMGDGEISGTGIEVSGEVTARFTRSEDIQVARPLIETRTQWITYAAAKTLEEASKRASSDLVRFVSSKTGMDFEDALMLASAVADLKISQVVDPLMAARMSISKRYL